MNSKTAMMAGLCLLAGAFTQAAAPPLTTSKTITIDAPAAKVWQAAIGT